jgi:hypothetical protein
LAIYEKAADAVVLKRVSLAGIMAQVGKDGGGKIEAIESTPVCSDPDGAIIVLNNRENTVAAERTGIFGIVAKVEDAEVLAVKNIQSPAINSHQQEA